MYAMGRRAGMGDLDWNGILNNVISTAGKTYSAVENSLPGYYGYPTGTTPAPAGGMDLTTVALLGVGIFFLLKVMKR